MIDPQAVQAETTARKQYQHALRQGRWQRLTSLITQRCNDLLPYQRVQQHLSPLKWRDLGLQTVALDAIVGSAGREHDFDLHFLPRRAAHDARWPEIARAHAQGIRLPPVTLYKIGHAYFVQDGNHRISVARTRNQQTLQAQVIEIDPTSLTPSHQCTRLGYKV